jgi:hypothetical protein
MASIAASIFLGWHLLPPPYFLAWHSFLLGQAFQPYFSSYSYWAFISCMVATSSPGVKRLGHEADHSPPTSAKVKKRWIYIFTHTYIFMA